MKMILSAIVTLSAVAAFANQPANTSGTTGTTSSTTTTTTAPAAPATTTHESTTTTTKEAKTHTQGMTQEQAAKACAKDTNKDACMKKYMNNPHTM